MALFSDASKQKLYNAYLRGETLDSENVHFLVAAMPKSGSTFLVTALSNFPGFQRTAIVSGHDRRENEPAIEILVNKHHRNWAAQAHVRYSKTMSRLMNAFALQPIFQVRNLFDVVMSLHDHLMRISLVNPIAYVPDEFMSWHHDRRLEFITETWMPWYFNFFMSWQQCDNKITVIYEDLIADPLGELQRIVEEAELRVSAAQLERALNKAKVAPLKTKNRVVAGRGDDLPHGARAHIERLAGYYSGVDFSAIGL